MLSDNVRIWAREQKCLRALSEDREWRRSCDVSRQVVPYRGAGSCECATADCGMGEEEMIVIGLTVNFMNLQAINNIFQLTFRHHVFDPE